MNQAVHQLLQLILQGVTWALRIVDALWAWSLTQIHGAFNVPWENLPGWKVALAFVAIAVLAIMLIFMIVRGLEAFSRIAAAFWTIAVVCFGILSFVVMAGLLSRGFQWVVASVPDDFWARLL